MGFSSKLKQEVWRLLEAEHKDPFMNMAVEETIARSVGKRAVPNTVRLWRNLDAVVIGSYQDVNSEVNPELCAGRNIKIVRRFTGGGAVYHDRGNLNFAIALSQDHPLVRTDLLDTFEVLSEGVIRAIRILGIRDVEWKSDNSILIKNLKVSGLAGCVRWGAFFCHGSILVSSNLSLIPQILCSREPADHRFVRSLRKTMTTVSHESGRHVSMSEMKTVLREGFEDALGIRLLEGKLTREELVVASRLLQEKYSTVSWNLGNPWE